jgi:hypothetical protein
MYAWKELGRGVRRDGRRLGLLLRAAWCWFSRSHSLRALRSAPHATTAGALHDDDGAGKAHAATACRPAVPPARVTQQLH